jgi:hypothetical protein
MDQYGIPSALKIALAELEARDLQTGRTERMLDQVTDGDVIVALTEDDCAVIRELLSRRNCKAHVTSAPIPISSEEWSQIFPGSPLDKTYFDHAYIIRYYRYMLEELESTFDMMHDQQWLLPL